MLLNIQHYFAEEILVYNKALAARTEGWYERQERVSYKQTSSMLTGWKKLEELDFRGGCELRSTKRRD